MHLCGFATSSQKPDREPRKVLVLGDGACGKTSLLNVLIKHEFPQSYEPTVFENYVHSLRPIADGPTVELSIWDTAGQEDFDRLRSLSYADTHVVMLCFSVNNPVSLENIESRWLPEIRENCPGVTVVLVALKCDLRDGSTSSLSEKSSYSTSTTYEDGVSTAKRIKATRYLECSAKHNWGVDQAFTETAKVALQSKAAGKDYGHHQSCVIC